MTVFLTVFAIAVSVSLLLGVERLRTEARASFSNTVSGTDLIVGTQRIGAPAALLRVRIGNATNNISWRSYQDIAANPDVAWTIPVSLGIHRGFRVVGTNTDYFRHFRYARARRQNFPPVNRLRTCSTPRWGARHCPGLQCWR